MRRLLDPSSPARLPEFAGSSVRLVHCAINRGVRGGWLEQIVHRRLEFSIAGCVQPAARRATALFPGSDSAHFEDPDGLFVLEQLARRAGGWVPNPAERDLIEMAPAREANLEVLASRARVAGRAGPDPSFLSRRSPMRSAQCHGTAHQDEVAASLASKSCALCEHSPRALRATCA